MAPTYKPTDVGPFLKAIQRPKSLLDTYQQGMDRATKREYNELVLDERKKDFEDEQKLDEIYSSIGETAINDGYGAANKELQKKLGDAKLGKELMKAMKEGREFEEKARERKIKTLELMYRSGKEQEAQALAQQENLNIDFNQYNKRQKVGNDIYEITPSGKTRKILSVPDQKGSDISKVLINPSTREVVTVKNKKNLALTDKGFYSGNPNDIVRPTVLSEDDAVSKYLGGPTQQARQVITKDTPIPPGMKAQRNSKGEIRFVPK